MAEHPSVPRIFCWETMLQIKEPLPPAIMGQPGRGWEECTSMVGSLQLNNAENPKEIGWLFNLSPSSFTSSSSNWDFTQSFSEIQEMKIKQEVEIRRRTCNKKSTMFHLIVLLTIIAPSANSMSWWVEKFIYWLNQWFTVFDN